MASKFALLIGNSAFEDAALSQLAAPKYDVEALREVLLDSDIGAFDRADILLNANLQAVRQAVYDIFANAASDDLILLYYAGHGMLDFHNQLYLALRDTSSEAPAIASLEASYVRERMRQSPSQRQVIIMDCCYSGAFMEGRSASVGATALTGETFEAVGSGRYVLTACTQTQFSFEKGNIVKGSPAEIQPAVFTRAIVEGLRTGLGNTKNDNLTISALFAFARDRVRQLDSRMTPKLWTEDAEDLVIARNPRWSPPLDERALQALNQGDKMARLGSVGVLARYLKSDNRAQAQEARRVLELRLQVEDSISVQAEIATALGGEIGLDPQPVSNSFGGNAPKVERLSWKEPYTWDREGSRGSLSLLPLLWMLGINYNNGPYNFDFTALYLPIAAWLGARHGRIGFYLLVIGSAPLLVPFRFTGFGTWSDPGFYIACLIICCVFGQENYRQGILKTAALERRSLVFMFVALGTRFDFRGDLGEVFGALDLYNEVILGTYFLSYLHILLFLIGMTSISLRMIIAVLLWATSAGFAVAIFATVPRVMGFTIHYDIDNPGEVLTALVLIYCGRLTRIGLTQNGNPGTRTALPPLGQGLPWPKTIPTLIQVATILLVSQLLTSLHIVINLGYSSTRWDMMSPVASIALLFALGFLYGRSGMIVACGVWLFTNILLPSLLVMIDFFFFADFKVSVFADVLSLRVTAPGYFSRAAYRVAPGFGLSIVDPVFAVLGWTIGRTIIICSVKHDPSRRFPPLSFRIMDVVWTVLASIVLVLALIGGVLWMAESISRVK